MIDITTYDEIAVKEYELNKIPVHQLQLGCKAGNIKLDINNGVITSATQTHRDYVSIYDGRVNYK